MVNSVEQSPAWEVGKSTASQEILQDIFWLQLGFQPKAVVGKLVQK